MTWLFISIGGLAVFTAGMSAGYLLRTLDEQREARK